MEPEAQAISQLFRPTLGTSLLRTFRFVSATIYGVCWLLCLPVELLLHRRVGKRYMNTLGFAVSILLTLTAAAVLIPPPGINAVSATGELSEPQIAAVRAYGETIAPVSFVLWGSMLAFVAHYLANRRRFGTPRQGHSTDAGVPIVVYPPLPARWLSAAAGRLGRRLTDRLERLPRGLRGVAGRMFNPVIEHLARLESREAPYGRMTWLVSTILQPVALILGGAWAWWVLGVHPGVGGYFGLVGVAMFAKGRIVRAAWVERLYDEQDQRLEVEAVRRLRSGAPGPTVSEAFTVPIESAVLAPRRPTSPRAEHGGLGAVDPLGPLAASVRIDTPDQTIVLN